ncbi:MAG: protein kinase [Xanthomonadales bacterium]|nr:Serine/threonine-protein kinase PknD [Xanthomonadales bacterium]MCC6594350.1 protein kinase [Xanthomonadales bacterium]
MSQDPASTSPLGEATTAAVVGNLKTAATPGEPGVGARIGPWVLLRLLGHGGMGAVWLAERSERDFQQRAALKLIKLGMDSAEILRRFVAERRILARLDHPNIARLIDGGVDLAGRPWFAMEYVDGLALGDYANAQALDAPARVRLFLKLCDAVAHAHRQLVVHRDLKPGNILVDARGEPRLLDFGIAKLLESDPENDTSATGARFFTRAYASPEQIRGEPIGTATDIYALGAVLFELLSGCALHHARLATGETRDLLVLARHRAGGQGPPPVSARALGGDLGLILAKAVRAEAPRRYASVDGFAEDLRAWLDGRPVRARPDSLGYRTRRFVRRHWIGAGASTAVLLALVAGAALALWQARLAREEALRAEAVSQFLSEVFASATPEGAADGEVSARSLLETGSARIERELEQAPAVRARLHASLGEAWHSLGDYARAIEIFETGRALVASEDWRTEVALLRGLAKAELATGQLKLARTHLDQANQRLAAAAPDDRYERVLTRALEKSLTGAEGHTALARMQAQAVYREWLELEGPDHERTLVALNDLGTWTFEAGEHAAALAIFDRVIEARRRVSGALHPELALTLHNRVLALRELGRIEEARVAVAEVLALRRRILPPQHCDTARTLGLAASLEAGQGQLERARELRGEAIAMLRAQRRPDPLLLGQELTNQGVDAINLGDWRAAREELAEALASLLAPLGADDARVQSAGAYLGLAEANLGELETARGRLEAIIERQGAQAPLAQQLPARRYLARVLRWQGQPRAAIATLGGSLLALGRNHELGSATRARAHLEHALALLDAGDSQATRDAIKRARASGVATDSTDGAQIRLTQARFELAQQRPQAALGDAQAALATLTTLQGANHPATAEARCVLALARWLAQHDAQSRAALESALAWASEQRPWHPDTRTMRAALAH